MSAEHLSVLELEEAAAGLPSVTGVHLEGCPLCQAKVAELKGANDALRTSPQFQARLASVLQQVSEKPIARMDPETGELTISKREQKNESRPPEPPRPAWVWLMPTLALAASLAAFVFWPRPVAAPQDEVRLKGSPALRVVGVDGRKIDKTKAGQMVELAVTSAGFAHGLVLAVDPSGKVDVLWPRDSTQSARVPTGAGAHLEPAFEVTPGNLKLIAVFAEGPFAAEVAQAQVAAAVEKAKAAGKSPLEAELPAGTMPAAATLLQVEP
jgi:hypothetical protein